MDWQYTRLRMYITRGCTAGGTFLPPCHRPSFGSAVTAGRCLPFSTWGWRAQTQAACSSRLSARASGSPSSSDGDALYPPWRRFRWNAPLSDAELPDYEPSALPFTLRLKYSATKDPRGSGLTYADAVRQFVRAALIAYSLGIREGGLVEASALEPSASSFGVRAEDVEWVQVHALPLERRTDLPGRFLLGLELPLPLSASLLFYRRPPPSYSACVQSSLARRCLAGPVGRQRTHASLKRSRGGKDSSLSSPTHTIQSGLPGMPSTGFSSSRPLRKGRPTPLTLSRAIWSSCLRASKWSRLSFRALTASASESHLSYTRPY